MEISVGYTLNDAAKAIGLWIIDNDMMKGWKESADDKGAYAEGPRGERIMVLSEREARIFQERSISYIFYRLTQIEREGVIYQSYPVQVGDDDYYVTYCNKCWYETEPTPSHPGKSKFGSCPNCNNPNFKFHCRGVPREYVERPAAVSVSALMNRFGK